MYYKKLPIWYVEKIVRVIKLNGNFPKVSKKPGERQVTCLILSCFPTHKKKPPKKNRDKDTRQKDTLQTNTKDNANPMVIQLQYKPTWWVWVSWYMYKHLAIRFWDVSPPQKTSVYIYIHHPVTNSRLVIKKASILPPGISRVINLFIPSIHRWKYQI